MSTTRQHLTIMDRKPGYRYDVCSFGDNVTFIWTPLTWFRPWKRSKRRYGR